MMKRPNMTPYFRALIDVTVNGMRASRTPMRPQGVTRVIGGLRDSVITVVMTDGTEWRYSAGQYSSRKVNGCYAPLMPKPVK